MKKITLSVALLLFGGGYFANAQVGIGTPTPASSSMLEIKADDKGVLIPRVALKSTDKFEVTAKAMAGVATESESLLVYNTATAGAGTTAVTPGFYYWVLEQGSGASLVAAHWERIVNQSQLDEIIKDLDLGNILELLTHVYPSNNLDGTNVAPGDKTKGGGMVYVPAVGAPGDAGYVAPKITYVYHNGTEYVNEDMTDIIKDIVKSAESKTLIVQNAAKTKHYYVAEEYLQKTTNPAPTEAIADGWAAGQVATPAVDLPAGVYQIDIVNGVINNIEEIFTTNSTIVINKGDVVNEKTFNTVEEYIQYIANSAETETFIRKVDGTPANTTAGSEAASTPDKYYYFSEKAIKDWLADDTANTDVATMPVTAPGVVEIKILGDVATNFEFLLNQETTYGDQTNITIKEIIEQLAAEAGGNVHYTETIIPVETTDPAAGQLEIPANSFYIIKKDAAGKDLRVEISLGNTLATGTTVKTKDTFGGKAVYIYNATTTMVAGTATTNGVAFPTLPTGVTMGKILSIRVVGPTGTSSVTDVDYSDGTTIKFNMGSGTMYNVLPSGVNYDVIIEFAAQ